MALANCQLIIPGRATPVWTGSVQFSPVTNAIGVVTQAGKTLIIMQDYHTDVKVILGIPSNITFPANFAWNNIPAPHFTEERNISFEQQALHHVF